MKITTAIRNAVVGFAFAGAVGVGSGTAGAATFQYGDFDPGDTSTSSPGSSYDFAGLGFSFTTNPVAFKWGYYDDNVIDQSPANIAVQLAAWTGFTIDSQVQFADIPKGATGFSATLPAEIFAVHLGQAELVFIFDTATTFVLSNFLQTCTNGGPQECVPPAFFVGGLSNWRSYNYTDPNQSIVPIPAALPLLVTALGGLTWLSRRRRSTPTARG